MIDLGCEKNRFLTKVKSHTGQDETFCLYYRRPTSEEIVAYNKSLLIKKNGKVVNNVVPTRIEYGSRILSGVQDGIIYLNGKPVSSDPASPDFYADWKGLLKTCLSNTIATLAFQVFESVSDVQVDQEEILATEEGEDTPPLASS